MSPFYKMVATDLDGTLLDESGRLTAENSAAISRLSAMGALVVPTTGRALSEIPAAVKEHPDIRYIISSNGARIDDKLTGEVDAKLMSSELSRRIFTTMLKYPCYFSNHVDGVGYIDADIPESRVTDYGLIPYYVQFFKDVSVPRGNYNAFFSSGCEVEMFAAFLKERSSLESLFSELSLIDGALATASSGSEIEVISTEAGKANGVRRLASKLGIPLRQVVTAGDNRNDADMLKASGASVASVHALPEIKAQATCVQADGSHLLEFILDRFFKE